MSITIKKMEQENTNEWASMRLKLWSDYTIQEHIADIQEVLESKNYSGYMALLANSQPIGFAEVSIRPYANGCEEKPVPFLEGIWVDPAYQRQGVGKSLLRQIGNDLITHGYTELCSDAEINNETSHRAHHKWGFYETERVIYYRKPLIGFSPIATIGGTD